MIYIIMDVLIPSLSSKPSDGLLSKIKYDPIERESKGFKIRLLLSLGHTLVILWWLMFLACRYNQHKNFVR